MNTNQDRIQLMEHSLDSLKNYVGEICTMLLETHKSRELQDTVHIADKACSKIRNMFHGTLLPHLLADEITCALLEEIMAKFSCPNFETWAPDIFLQLIDSVMHPKATRIILQPDPVHSNFFSKFRMGTIPLIVQNLSINSNARALRFGHMNRHIDFNWIHYPKLLQELSIEGYLSDERLEAIVESCKQLKVLNVSRSSNISDKSIDNILKLKLLQALYISRTSITKDGIQKLLIGCSLNEANRLADLPFKCFGGQYDTNIKTLVDSLPNISELVLFYSCDSLLLDLAKLKRLKSLSIGTNYRDTLPSPEVLNPLGKQLTCLDLENFETIDIKCIGENCHSLKCFHISGYAAFDTELPVSEEYIASTRIAGFLSVECLCVEIPKDQLGTIIMISQCHNVRRLFVSLYEISLEEVIEVVSKYNKMEYLESLYVTPRYDIPREFANFLAGKYKHLRVCHGNLSDVKRACGVRFSDW